MRNWAAPLLNSLEKLNEYLEIMGMNVVTMAGTKMWEIVKTGRQQAEYNVWHRYPITTARVGITGSQAMTSEFRSVNMNLTWGLTGLPTQGTFTKLTGSGVLKQWYGRRIRIPAEVANNTVFHETQWTTKTDSFSVTGKFDVGGRNAKHVTMRQVCESRVKLKGWQSFGDHGWGNSKKCGVTTPVW